MTETSSTNIEILRSQIRNAVLNAKPATRRVVFFGQEVELRQPDLAEILSHEGTDDALGSAINMIIKYVYVPGTDRRVFEDTDVNVIRKLPFGQDMNRLQSAITELTGVALNIEAEVKN